MIWLEMKGLRMANQSLTKLEELESKMSPQQKAFVDNLLRLGNKRGAPTQAAKEAGYAEASARVAASRNLSNPKIQEYLHIKVMDAMGGMVPAALGAINKIITSGKSELVKLQAAQDVLDRAGYKPVEKKAVMAQGEIHVTIDLS